MKQVAFETEIHEAIEHIFSVLRRKHHPETLRCLTPQGELNRCYQIFGGRLLDSMLNQIPQLPWRIALVQPEGALVRVVLRAAGGKWTTLWLEKTGGRWRLAQAYPVRSGEGDDIEEPPAEFVRLCGGDLDLPVECHNPELTLFVRALHQKALASLRPGTSTHRGKVASLFDLTQYLWLRRQLWTRLRRQGYRVVGFQITGNNDIYDAIRKDGSERAAVKALRNRAPIMKTRFLQEIEVLQALSGQPQVPSFLDWSQIESWPYYAVSWVPGEPLQRLLRRDPAWSLRRRLRLAYEIARSAYELRSHNVIHRDLAADNIIIQGECDLSLIDFGMASFIDRLEEGELKEANGKEFRNLGLLLCYLLIDHPSLRFGSARHHLQSWREALEQLRHSAVPDECLSIASRAIVADPDCRPLANGTRPYRHIISLLDDLSGLLARL